MPDHNIATIINFCTYDSHLISHCVSHASKFSQQVLVTYCDHFYDGTPENSQLLTQSIANCPEASFVSFAYNHRKTASIWRGYAWLLRLLKLGTVYGPSYWADYSRLIGYQHLDSTIDYVLFLDSDEIVDDSEFLHWLDTGIYRQHSAIKLANYWYFRSPCYQAKQIEDSAVLIKRNQISYSRLMTHEELHGLYLEASGKKIRMATNDNNKPMIHHYAWAKPLSQLRRKVLSWSHAKDRNWLRLLEEEYSRPFTGTDFIYHRKYRRVKPFIVYMKDDSFDICPQ